MIKKIAIMILVMIMFIAGLYLYNNSEVKLYSFIDEFGLEKEDIVYIKSETNGAYIYGSASKDIDYCYYFDKSILGWRYGHDTVSTGLEPYIKRCGFTISNLNKVGSVKYPVYYGKIHDKEISNMIITDNQSGVTVIVDDIYEESVGFWSVDAVKITNLDDVTIRAYSRQHELISELVILPNGLEFNYYKNTGK